MKPKATYESEILEVINKYNIFAISDIFAFYPSLKKSQFYNLELEKSDLLKEALDNNKVKTKQTLKSKWSKSENPTLQIALFKTICSDEERRALSQTYIDHTTKDNEIKQVITIAGQDITF